MANAALAHGIADSIEGDLDAVDQVMLLLRAMQRRDPAGFDLPTVAADLPLLNLSGIGLEVASPPPGRRPADAAQRMMLALPAPRAGGGWGISAWKDGSGWKGTGASDGRGPTLVADIPTGFLTNAYSTYSLAGHVVQVLDDDGVLMARLPRGDGDLGRPARDAALVVPAGAAHGAVIAADAAGVGWVTGYRRLPTYGLLVTVGLPADAVLAPFYADAWRRLGLAAALTALLLAACRLIWHQQKLASASRRNLMQALDNISQGVVMIAPDGRLLVVNRSARELLGLPDDLIRSEPNVGDIIGWQIARGEFGPPDQVPADVLAALHAGRFSKRGTLHERIRPDGTVLEIRTAQLPQGGSIRSFSDITERKRKDAALAATSDAAETAGRARTDFLAVMSHEIRTPMNGIIGMSSLLLDMPLGSTEQHYVRIILDSGQGLLRMINDILDFSRLDAGRLDLAQQAFDLRHVVQDACDLLSPEARAKGLDLITDVADDVPKQAVGDRLRLRQVLLNLLGNGIKFTSEGSVRLSVSRVRVEGASVRLSFAVIDTGIGIPAEAVGRLFQEFTQVDSSISRRFGGSGLGLAISRRLVERMGGAIEVESTVGLGTTCRFDVLLGTDGGLPPPALPPPGLPEPAAAAPALPVFARVLVAEDNATNRLVVTRMLECQGLQVVAVENGRLAVEAMRDGAFDVVLMDVAMPELDGLAATRLIRAMDGPGADVPIIGLTANSGRDDEASCLAAGMNRFETKPISRQRLATVIAGALAARKAKVPA